MSFIYLGLSVKVNPRKSSTWKLMFKAIEKRINSERNIGL